MDFFEILKNIKVPDWFGVYENDTTCLSPDAEWYESQIYAEARKIGISISTAWGCSQFVIITEDKQVFKIPFNGFFYDDNDEHYDACFEYFKVNHSDKTVEAYENAITEGVEQFFSGIECIGYSCNQYPIYRQEWAQTYAEDDSSKPSEDSTTKAKNLSKEIHYIPFYTDWLASAIDTYGEEFVKKLLWFVDKYDITDLHRNNYGYNQAGRPVVFDYSGFDDSIAW